MRSVPPRGSGWVLPHSLAPCKRFSTARISTLCHHPLTSLALTSIIGSHVERHRHSTGLLHFLPYLRHLAARRQARIYRSLPQSLSLTIHSSQQELARSQSATAQIHTTDPQSKAPQISRSSNPRDLRRSQVAAPGDQRAHKSRPYCGIGRSEE